MLFIDSQSIQRLPPLVLWRKDKHTTSNDTLHDEEEDAFTRAFLSPILALPVL